MSTDLAAQLPILVAERDSLLSLFASTDLTADQQQRLARLELVIPRIRAAVNDSASTASSSSISSSSTSAKPTKRPDDCPVFELDNPRFDIRADLRRFVLCMQTNRIPKPEWPLILVGCFIKNIDVAEAVRADVDANMQYDELAVSLIRKLRPRDYVLNDGDELLALKFDGVSNLANFNMEFTAKTRSLNLNIDENNALLCSMYLRALQTDPELVAFVKQQHLNLVLDADAAESHICRVFMDFALRFPRTSRPSSLVRFSTRPVSSHTDSHSSIHSRTPTPTLSSDGRVPIPSSSPVSPPSRPPLPSQMNSPPRPISRQPPSTPVALHTRQQAGSTRCF